MTVREEAAKEWAETVATAMYQSKQAALACIDMIGSSLEVAKSRLEASENLHINSLLSAVDCLRAYGEAYDTYRRVRWLVADKEEWLKPYFDKDMRITAIKEFRKRYGTSLRESKEEVDKVFAGFAYCDASNCTDARA